MGEPRVLGAGERAMLAELRWRAERAYNLLGELFSEEGKYFHEKAELLIEELDLLSTKASMLLDFAEKIIECLDKAYPQAETKLQKLLTALGERQRESGAVPMRRKDATRSTNRRKVVCTRIRTAMQTNLAIPTTNPRGKQRSRIPGYTETAQRRTLLPTNRIEDE